MFSSNFNCCQQSTAAYILNMHADEHNSCVKNTHNKVYPVIDNLVSLNWYSVT
jgi:hypothetical protein